MLMVVFLALNVEYNDWTVEQKGIQKIWSQLGHLVNYTHKPAGKDKISAVKEKNGHVITKKTWAWI